MKNTQIYPVVKISDDYFSTNNTTFEGNYCKPILLNIPSIKQSVDIESRKFKISNVSLDLSNFPVSGERFSDRLSTSSLINTEVVVYFVHHDTSEEVYRGQIRRISHDDEKVKIELEDLTEQKAHKDLPKSTTPASNYLPDKYANKPIPIVYGHVDKSPLVPYYSYSEDIDDDSDEEGAILEYRLKIDSNDIMGEVEETVSVGSSDFIKSALFINENDAYFNLHKTNAALGTPPNEDGTQAGVENFRFEETSVVLDTNMSNYTSESEELLENDTVNGRLRIHQFRRFNKVDWQPTEYDMQFGNILQGELSIDTSVGLGHITGTIDLDVYVAGPTIDFATRDWNAGHFKCILEPISIPNSLAKDTDGNTVNVVTRLLIDIEHYNFQTTGTTPEGETPNDHNAVFQNPTGGNGHITQWAAWVGANTIYVYTGGQADLPYPETQINRDTSYNNITGDDSIDTILTDFNTPTKYDSINIGIPKHLHQASLHAQSDLLGVSDEHDSIFGVDTTINDAFIVQTILLDGISDKDYYANVNGRVNTFDDHPDPPDEDFIQNPIDIIYDILRSELGLTAEQINEDDYAEARDEHNEWEFAFTVNKKINSKKLIEEIAKSTKCFPKFRNDGTFGFNTIKGSYTVSNDNGTGDYETATEIYEQDVINYSFKKTKPEQIYKKVDVQYKKDYAQDSYLQRTEPLGNNEDSYYGIQQDEAILEFESDYIRHEETANHLNKFLKEQYRNDHLIFNLKLPLSYNQLEVGDLVKFRSLLNGIKAYGIDYRLIQDIGIADEDSGYKQRAFPLFMVTSTKKNLDSIEIECMQLHYLHSESTIVPSTWYDGVLNSQGNFIEGDETGLFYFPEYTPVFATEEEIDEEEQEEIQENTPPYFTSINDITVYRYDEFNPNDYTPFAYDHQDGSLTNSIITSMPQEIQDAQALGTYLMPTGTYTVNYSVTDSDGATSSFSQQVTVLPYVGIPPENDTLVVSSHIYIEQDGTARNLKSNLNDVGEPLFNFTNYPDTFYGTGYIVVSVRLDNDEVIWAAAQLQGSGITDDTIYSPQWRYASSGTNSINEVDMFNQGSEFRIWAVSLSDVVRLGDANNDGFINVLDVVSMVNHMLNIQEAPSPQAIDVNQDGYQNILDIVSLVNTILGD